MVTGGGHAQQLKPKRFGHLLRPAVGVPVGLGQTGTPTAGNKFRNLLPGCLDTYTYCTRNEQSGVGGKLPRVDLLCFFSNTCNAASLYDLKLLKGSVCRPLPAHGGEEEMVRHGGDGVPEWAWNISLPLGGPSAVVPVAAATFC